MGRAWMWIRRTIFIGLLVCLAALHCAGRINLTTADLGRHLKNGELFLQEGRILSTNFYSYTHPDYPATCHHWLSGVVFYGIFKQFDFPGLDFFFIGLLLVTLLLFFAIGARNGGFWTAALVSVLVLPLVGYRIEIRPEAFSVLFLGIFFFLLQEYRERRMPGRWLWSLPVLQMMWVNLHVFFILGIAVTGLFAVDILMREERGERFRTMAVITGVTAAACFINPFGLNGLLEPFKIFHSYGYELAENQNVFFMMKRFPDQVVYPYFLAMGGVLLLLLTIRTVIAKDRKGVFLSWALSLLFGLMAAKVVRGIAMFGCVAIPLIAENIGGIVNIMNKTKIAERLAAILAITALGVGLVNPYTPLSALSKFRSSLPADGERYRNSYFYTLSRPALWTGLVPGVNGSAEFWRSSGLKGPIFNNYDIGGYLILYLYPSEKVFVDNRPEAYPVDFFRKVYVPMQEDDALWKDVEGKYNFQAIYFYRRDMTPWAQPFLIKRVRDPLWAPVFVDDYTVIFARRGGINQKVIDRYELPKSMFRVTE